MPPRRPTRKSKHMLLLGYELSVQDFAEFILTIPRPDNYYKLPENPTDSMALVHYLAVYDHWKNYVFPKTPNVEPLYDHVNNIPRPISFFFVLRYGRYDTREKLLEHIPKAVESDSDRAKLAWWVQETERLGATLDPAKLTFKCIEPDDVIRHEYDYLPMTRGA